MTARPHTPRPLRVMVVDDSDATRAVLGSILRSDPGVEVVLSTPDADEALRRAIQEPPDVVCLDLQMPRMDGFTFLRLLMARRPTPVVVISSNSRKQDVFKALELGALDFVAKPDLELRDDSEIRAELLAKLATARALRIENLDPRRPVLAPRAAVGLPARGARRLRVAVVGASTGGPSAIARLLALLPPELPLAIVIAQHMPEKFTRAFAERLDRTLPFDVREAADGDALVPGRVLVAPGGKHLTLVRGPGTGGPLHVHVAEPRAGDGRHRPSVDVLFASAADAAGANVCAVVLTGMGSDGRAGVGAVKEAGGATLAESEQTAVVYGMPKEAAASGHVDEVLPLDELADRLVRFASAP
jgi:two-component system chemotaxis response regulator CheB